MIKDYLSAINWFFKSYALLFVINIIFSMIIIFAEKRKPISTLLWVMAINFLPIFGFILYLFIGQDLSKKRMFDKRGSIKEDVGKISSAQLDLIKSGKKPIKERTKNYLDIIELFNKGEQELLYSRNSVIKYNDGKDMFKQLFEDINNAKTAIYIQTYIFKSDELGMELIDLLKKKAQEGLEVILLVDGMGGRKFRNRDREDLKRNGVKVEIFFPGLFKTINTRINYRNHRKIIVIDHMIGYVGGLNIADEYVSRDKKFGFWRDTHLRITGDAVVGLEFRFFLDYRYASGREDGGFISIIPDAFKEEEKLNTEMCIVTSGPNTKVNSIRNGYGKMITRAKKSVYIQTPYFIPDDGLYNAIKTAVLSGVDVNIMIPKTRDHIFVHWASLSFLGDLIQWGVKAYLYDGGFLHSKVITCDDYLSSVGTANFDIRSFELNFEVNAFIFDEQLNRSLVEDFKADVEKSIEITKEYYASRSVMVKFKEGISRLLSPLL
ncbi:Major cardiolipin synthase ClsA [Peptoniphilus sp. ING2-D1G]|nr:Major cardiolipin synthase ClsA [Peptoniphilus sp. ING2-D1G]